jgi:uncharacterized protein YqgV (UPF0045/DUF77 family)
MLVSVQFSIYPLREAHLSPAINEAVDILKSFGLDVMVGSMSSVTYGDSEIVFKAFQKVYDEVALNSHVVLIMTLSNACPVPTKGPAQKKTKESK